MALEDRILVGLKDRLMAPDVAAEAVRAWAEETNRLNREGCASGEADRKELADIEKKMTTRPVRGGCFSMRGPKPSSSASPARGAPLYSPPR